MSVDGVHHAAVLSLLIIVKNQIHILFTHRTSKVNHHKDQVSLPGGEYEITDVDLVATAMRETQEEIGVDISRFEIIGQLSEIITPSGFLITPFVGFKEKLFNLKINRREVKRVFSIPLSWFTRGKNWSYEYIEIPKNKRKKVIKFNNYGGEVVWGITAQIILDLIQAII